jgi:hypothetical protein
MIVGAHIILSSTHTEADRAFFRDVLKLTHVDVGGGWLIFGLPPAEVAIHPAEENNVHEFYFMCRDIDAFVAEMKKHGIECDPVESQDWGHVTQITLPGGGNLGVYQPRHPRPAQMGAERPPAKPAARAAAPKAKKTPARPVKAKATRPAKKSSPRRAKAGKKR